MFWQHLFQKLEKFVMKLILNDKKKETVQVELTHQELRIIRESLTELIAGIDIEDFEFPTRLGCTRQEMGLISDDIIKIMDDEDIEL